MGINRVHAEGDEPTAQSGRMNEQEQAIVYIWVFFGT